MIEQGDTTRPAVVPSEPSEAVKQYKKKRYTQNVVLTMVDRSRDNTTSCDVFSKIPML